MRLSGTASGLTDPVHQAQQVFRVVLDAMARPGRIHSLTNLEAAAPALSPAATAVCLTLADFETPLWLDTEAQAARDYLAFHCGAPIAAQADHATFAVVANARELPDLDRFRRGSDEHPETSSTLIIEVAGLTAGAGVHLSGPGIRDRVALQVDGISTGFWQQLSNNRALFPRGVDLILTCDRRVAALPRSTRVSYEEV